MRDTPIIKLVRGALREAMDRARAQTAYGAVWVDASHLERALFEYDALLEQHAALKARVEELEKQLTVTDDRDRTHSDECWRWRRHHGCAIARAERLEANLDRIRAVVEEQAKDEGLWFIARTAPEAYLQQELRNLHRVIEETP